MSFLGAYIFVNLVLFTTRAFKYRNENLPYMVARACGKWQLLSRNVKHYCSVM